MYELLKSMVVVMVAQTDIPSLDVAQNAFPRDLKSPKRFILFSNRNIWYFVFGIWYLVFGIWYLVFGIWYLVFGI